MRIAAAAPLVAWDDDNSGLWLWSSKGSTRQIENVPFVIQPQIVLHGLGRRLPHRDEHTLYRLGARVHAPASFERP